RQTGQFKAPDLKPFIDQVRHLVAELGSRQGTEESRRDLRRILSDSLLALGDETGSDWPLKEALALYREALKEYPRDRVPQDWALIKDNLGIAIGTLGKYEA